MSTQTESLSNELSELPDYTDELIEFGTVVSLSFRGRDWPARRDLRSGYVFFEPPPKEFLKEYYETQYGNENPSYYSLASDYAPHRCRWKADELTSLAGQYGIEGRLRIHELGCCFGGVVAELAARGHDAFGSDLNKHAIEEGQRIKSNSRISHASHLDAVAAMTGKFDVISACHTLEHDPDMKAVVAACREKLNPHGIMFIEVPNSMFIRALLDGFRANPWTAFPDHLHMLSPGHIPILCEELGYEPLCVYTRNPFQFDPAMPSHFGRSFDLPHVRETWSQILDLAGMGMELLFAIRPLDSVGEGRGTVQTELLRSRLEGIRQAEVSIRDGLRGMAIKAPDPYRVP